MEQAPLNSDVAESGEGGAAYWVHTADRVRLRIAVWNDERATNGTIFFFPGRTEFIEKYGRTLPPFLRQGFAAFLVDWRGQGLSDRTASDVRLGHVDRFSDYQLDVTAVVRAGRLLDLPRPWYLLGHSMGANIGLRRLIAGMPVAACAFTAPMWTIVLPSLLQRLAKPLSGLAVLAGQGEMYTKAQKGKSYALHKSFEENSITTDREMYDYFIRQALSFPEAHIGAPSMRWLHEGLAECNRLTSMASPNIPCAAFFGSHDVTVGRKEIEGRMSRWPNGSFAVVNGAKHDLLCEKPNIRERVIEDLGAFFRSHR